MRFLRLALLALLVACALPATASAEPVPYDTEEQWEADFTILEEEFGPEEEDPGDGGDMGDGGEEAPDAALAAQAAAQNHCGSGYLDVPDQPFGFDFRQACWNHDLCYLQAAQSRRDCDTAFWNDLMDICNNQHGGHRGCRALANLYWWGVDCFGQGAYNGQGDPPSSGWCPQVALQRLRDYINRRMGAGAARQEEAVATTE